MLLPTLLRQCVGQRWRCSALVGPISLRNFSFLPDAAHLTDLTHPAAWYPAARALRRRIVAHVGPPNSGKTHAALEALMAAESGVYCGPLRLLAWEAATRINAAGVPCNLVTGQERQEAEAAQHTACTVEMAPTAKQCQVAVVDEIQLMACPVRGAAFTRALLGVPARQVHVAGDPAALPLLQRLVEDAGDDLEVRRYERLCPLRLARRPLPSLEAATRGDCVIAFSRREVHGIRRAIEAAGKHRCGVVYGSLPPTARTQQALLFNEARTGVNVLAASDAVGMGLNLNIKRVVFTSLEKYDGISVRPLTVAEVKQIAGRAGRHASRYETGTVTCLRADDMPRLKWALEQPNEEITHARILPRFQQLALFASHWGHAPFSQALEEFIARATLSPAYFLADSEVMLRIARLLDDLPLTLRERYTFCQAPADVDEPAVASALLTFARAYCATGLVTPDLIRQPPTFAADDEAGLRELELAHSIFELYVWLSLRMEDAFVGREVAEARLTLCAAAIQDALARLGRPAPARRKAVNRKDMLEAAQAYADAAMEALPRQRVLAPFNFSRWASRAAHPGGNPPTSAPNARRVPSWRYAFPEDWEHPPPKIRRQAAA